MRDLTDKIFVSLMASDYFNTFYNDRTGGPILNALARMGYNTEGAEDDETATKLDGLIYNHPAFTEADWRMDIRLASQLYYKHDTIIRSMILTKDGIKTKSDYLDSYKDKFKKRDWLHVAGAIALCIASITLVIYLRNFILN